MKLSEILGWIKKQPLITGQGANNRNKDVQFCRGYNTALTSCDREIDREALAKVLYQLKGGSENEMSESAKAFFARAADHFISTMPTWLKRSEKGQRYSQDAAEH